MRLVSVYACAAILCASLTCAVAATMNLDQWFSAATQFNASVTSTSIARPDFIGASEKTNCHWVTNPKLPQLQSGIWQLQKYDRTHHIGLAVATTDQCSSALFRASTPPVRVPDADLSNAGTARGLKIGSPYSQVLSIYGPPQKHGAHFVTRYSSDIPEVTAAGKPTKVPQDITIVVDNDRVSSITIYIDLGGLF
ncbi:MAG: hypothetical protein JO219_08020 [Candidatus Eremiobacteraeota bacterium]|nr:hypothetical protein [Candidatus Eremiobacteraeota bacterium]MBV8365561.1 hypothetical protein [Candidatus Eremiobacteraeota bacterium]